MDVFADQQAIVDLYSAFVPQSVAETLAKMALPALVFVESEQPTGHQIGGDALLPADAEWPTCRSHPLTPAARFTLSTLPEIPGWEGRPQSGTLSFFAGLHLDNLPEFSTLTHQPGDRRGQVRFDQDRDLVERPYPLHDVPSELAIHLVPDGVRWIVPGSEDLYADEPELLQTIDRGLSDRRDEFEIAEHALLDQRVRLAHLMGRPAAIQRDPTPYPRYVDSKEPDGSWLHLATITTPSMVFDHYFGVQRAELDLGSFESIAYAAQC